MGRCLAFRYPEKIAFRHSFFATFSTAQFRHDSNGSTPVIAFEMGDQQVVLPFEGLKREFRLAEYAADAVMLNTIARALDYVSLLQVGDAIPPEVLTGQASWYPDAAHFAGARRRVTTELVGWNLSLEVPREDPARTQQFIAQYVNDEIIRYSLLRLAARLGEGADGANRLSDVLDEIAEEYAYIEALRERASLVCSISDKLRNMRTEFASHNNIMSDLEPVARMISEPVSRFRETFAKIDDMLADIVSIFSDFRAARESFRKVRDDLGRRLAPWEQFRKVWNRISTRNADPFALLPALRDLYRFLAPRYMPVDEWKLVLAKGGADRAAGTFGSVITWYDSEPHVA